MLWEYLFYSFAKSSFGAVAGHSIADFFAGGNMFVYFNLAQVDAVVAISDPVDWANPTSDWVIRLSKPQASITPSQPAASSAVSGLRNFKPRTILALLAAIVICGVLVQWLAHRANSVSTSDARVAADLIAISAEISGTITAAHVRVGDRVESGDLIYEIDDREHVLQLEAQIAQRDGLQVQIEQTRMRVGLLNSKSGTQIDATQADERSAMAGVGAARSDLTTKQEEFDRFEKLFDRGRVTQDALDSSANALEAARQTLRAAQADVSSAAAKTRQAFLSVEDSDLVAQDLQILEAKVRQANAQIEEQKVRELSRLREKLEEEKDKVRNAG